MYPPVYASVKDDAAVKAVLGNSPRVYPFGEAPAKGSTQYALPYAVFQMIPGSAPLNRLSGVPDMDEFTVQVDVYGSTAASVTAAAEALRDALEPVAYVTSWRGQSRDPDTNNYRFGFDVDFMTPR